MLPTLVIGLREGLEAVLIVAILATFLRRNGATLTGLWIGVGAGVGLSVAVGVGLRIIEEDLPQAQQEALETVIGVIAVFFVTAMILWMRKHSRDLKADLEASAAAAIAQGTTTAAAVMAFLAVLREGFETAVFLLATVQNASSAPAALGGAVLGIALAVVLGIAIFRGGVRINMQRFFLVTGVFLVFVSAGLVLLAFRTAHEAGWITIGQGRTVDLSWLAPAGSIRSAVVTGVLGMPADPRVIELLAWGCYLVPMLVVLLWNGPSLPRRIQVLGAAALVGAATALALFVPAASQPARPTTLTASDLVATLGRTPIGLDQATAPGPYAATWSDHTVTVAGGGLSGARTYSVPAGTSSDPGRDRVLWRRWFPLTLLLPAAALAIRLPRFPKGQPRVTSAA
jgi:high-affinity iron transporter